MSNEVPRKGDAGRLPDLPQFEQVTHLTKLLNFDGGFAAVGDVALPSIPATMWTKAQY
jgi:hypothetical protein